jgi:hypothetical protein
LWTWPSVCAVDRSSRPLNETLSEMMRAEGLQRDLRPVGPHRERSRRAHQRVNFLM